MNHRPRLNALLLRWQEAREKGQELSTEELCRDCPELQAELDRHIAKIEAADAGTREHTGKFDLLLGDAPERSEEIQAMLRPRLCWGGLAFLILWTLFLIYTFLHGAFAPLALVSLSALLLAEAALVMLLWSARHFSLSQLRAFEMALFGIAAVFMGWNQLGFLWQGWLPVLFFEEDQHKLLVLLGDSTSLPWFALIVVYGTYIPNRARRCAVVVGCLALVPVAVMILAGRYDPVYGPRLLADGVFGVMLWMLFGSFLAIYGSHRIDTAQRESFEARKLGQYHLIRPLGEGGMGEVYLGEHQLLRRPCAIKLIRPERAGDVRTLLRFEREVRAMASLTHWNIVEVFDYGHAKDGTFYYVMEYLPGLSLDRLVEAHGPLTPGRVVHVLRQVCAALRAAHAVGLIHRDIKPSNILLCERGQVHDVVKLLDFGLVRTVLIEDEVPGKITVRGTVVGTPPYMSPEQIGSAELDGRADLYSLGATAYFLLTGRAPFERKTLKQLFAAHLTELPLPPAHLNPAIPADLQEVVMRCLSKQPEERFPNAQALEKALAGCACAGQWSEEQAEFWWRENDSEE